MATYSEGPDSFIQHNGQFYQLDKIFELTKDLPIKPMFLKELTWVIDPKKKDHHPDFEKRVKEADVTIAIIVIHQHGKWIPIDGYHRIHKANLLHKLMIPVKVISANTLEKARVEKIPIKSRRR